MLLSMKSLRGYNILASDGEVGKVRDLLFDDHAWRLRYLVADIGHWLPGRQVLISPTALREPDWASHEFPVALTRDEIEKSPPLSSDEPISRRHENELARYFAWQPYWDGRVPMAIPITAHATTNTGLTSDTGRGETDIKPGDPNLRSVDEVVGYHIHASDGQIGHVADFIIDDDGWQIRYAVVDTGNWLPGRKVIIALSWIEDISWGEESVTIELSRSQVKDSPAFDPSIPVNRRYEEILYDYYGRPRYWE